MLGLPFPALGRHRGAILLVALVALWLAQAASMAHAARHFGGDTQPLPAEHSQLCTDCASLLPMLAVAGGSGPALYLAEPARLRIDPASESRVADERHQVGFRSRAPPR
jgi:hypothetical protein